MEPYEEIAELPSLSMRRRDQAPSSYPSPLVYAPAPGMGIGGTGGAPHLPPPVPAAVAAAAQPPQPPASFIHPHQHQHRLHYHHHLLGGGHNLVPPSAAAAASANAAAAAAAAATASVSNAAVLDTAAAASFTTSTSTPQLQSYHQSYHRHHYHPSHPLYHVSLRAPAMMQQPLASFRHGAGVPVPPPLPPTVAANAVRQEGKEEEEVQIKAETLSSELRAAETNDASTASHLLGARRTEEKGERVPSSMVAHGGPSTAQPMAVADIAQPHHRADPVTASAVKKPAAEYELQLAILQARGRSIDGGSGGGGGGFISSNGRFVTSSTATEEDPRHLAVAAAAVVGQVLGTESTKDSGATVGIDDDYDNDNDDDDDDAEGDPAGISEPPTIEKKKADKKKGKRGKMTTSTPTKRKGVGSGGSGRRSYAKRSATTSTPVSRAAAAASKGKAKANKSAKASLVVPTGPVATAAEIDADTKRAHLDDAVSNSIFALCKEERWADVSNLVASNPSLAVAPMTMANNITTTILHQAITSKGDVSARANLVKFVLSIRPSAAAIKNGYGSLPIHVLAQRNCKMKSKVKEELLLALIHAHPPSIMVAGGVGARNPLHIVFTDYISADLCRKMLTLRPDAAKMRDKKGWLPIHVATSRHCSPEKLDMLLEAFPESLTETTNDGKTPLMLAKSTATKQHPNRTLLKALEERLKSSGKKGLSSTKNDRKGMVFASPARSTPGGGGEEEVELPPPSKRRRRRSSGSVRLEKEAPGWTLPLDESMPPLGGGIPGPSLPESDAAGILLSWRGDDGAGGGSAAGGVAI